MKISTIGNAKANSGKTKRLVVESSYFAGTIFGPCPDNWKFGSGVCHPTRVQRWLYQRRTDCINQYTEQYGRPDFLLVNGGMIDEIPHLDKKREVLMKDAMDQAELVIHLIEQWRARKTYVAFGAGKVRDVAIGNDDSMPVESYIASKVHASEASWAIKPVLHGTRCSFAYKITTSRSVWQHRTTPLAVQMAVSRLQREEKDANLLIRSAPRYLCYVGFDSSTGMISPGWAAQTPYEAREMPENVAKVGIVVVELPSRHFNYMTWNAPLLEAEVYSRGKRAAKVNLATFHEAEQLAPATPASRPLKGIEALLATGDWHCGSTWGLCPDNWRLLSGARYHPNPVQEELFGHFLECAEEFKRPDYLLVNGDLIDGSGKIDSARDICFTNVFDQIRLAEYLVELLQPKHLGITYGSKYHVERDSVPIEEIIARDMGADNHGFIIKPTLSGVPCSFSHEIPPSSNWAYRPTAVSIQLVMNRLQGSGTKLMIRAHNHQSCFAGFSDQLGIVTPCFEGQTPFTARKVTELKPKIGVVGIALPSLDVSMRVWDGPAIPETLNLEKVLLPGRGLRQ